MQTLKRSSSIGGILISIPLLLMLSSCAAFVNAIVISSASISPGETGSVFISASGIMTGLQGIEISARAGDSLTFDSQIIEVVEVKAVDPFALDAVNIDNVNGRISLIARTPAVGPFPSEGQIVEVVVKGLRPGISAMDLSITNLADPNNLPLTGIRVAPGSVQVGLEGQP